MVRKKKASQAAKVRRLREKEKQRHSANRQRSAVSSRPEFIPETKRNWRRKESDAVTRIAEFFDAVGPRQEIAMGIDCGVKGAIAFVADGCSAVVEMPVRKEKRKKPTFDCEQLLEILFYPATNAQQIVACFVEHQQARVADSGVVAFKVGYGYGLWPLWFAQQSIPLYPISPLAWKRDWNLLKEGKDASRAVAQRLWPREQLYLVKDDGRAEALLIAEAGRKRLAAGRLPGAKAKKRAKD